MKLSEEGLCEIEHQADKVKNVNLMFLVQILKELREVKALLEVHQKPSDCGDNGSSGADNRKDEYG